MSYHPNNLVEFNQHPLPFHFEKINSALKNTASISSNRNDYLKHIYLSILTFSIFGNWLLGLPALILSSIAWCQYEDGMFKKAIISNMIGILGIFVLGNYIKKTLSIFIWLKLSSLSTKLIILMLEKLVVFFLLKLDLFQFLLNTFINK